MNESILIGVCDRAFELGIGHSFTIVSDTIGSQYYSVVKKYVNDNNMYMSVIPDRTCRIFCQGNPKQQIGYIFIYGDLSLNEQKFLEKAHLLGEKNVCLQTFNN